MYMVLCVGAPYVADIATSGGCSLWGYLVQLEEKAHALTITP